MDYCVQSVLPGSVTGIIFVGKLLNKMSSWRYSQELIGCAGIDNVSHCTIMSYETDNGLASDNYDVSRSNGIIRRFADGNEAVPEDGPATVETDIAGDPENGGGQEVGKSSAIKRNKGNRQRN